MRRLLTKSQQFGNMPKKETTNSSVHWMPTCCKRLPIVCWLRAGYEHEHQHRQDGRYQHQQAHDARPIFGVFPCLPDIAEHQQPGQWNDREHDQQVPAECEELNHAPEM